MGLLPQPVVACPVVVLRTWPSGETSTIASLLTADAGYVRVIGKGARKQRSQLRPLLHAGRLIHLEFSLNPERQLQYARGGSLLLDPLAEATSLEKSAFLLASVELLDRCRPTGDCEAELFALCQDFFRVLSCAPTAGEAATFYAFELALLRLQGTAPELTACCGCNETQPPRSDRPLRFDPASGGLVCPRCLDAETAAGSRQLTVDARAALLALAEADWRDWSRCVLARELAREIGILLHRFLAYHLPGYRLPAALDLLPRRPRSAATDSPDDRPEEDRSQ